MKLLLPTPRLLPLTIAVMAVLLVVRSVDLVRAAVPADAAASETASPPAPPKPPEPAMKPPAEKPAAEKPADADMAATKIADAAPAPPKEPPISDSERALLLELRQRREQLDAQSAALATRETVLSAAEARLTARMDELGNLQRRLEALDAARKDRDEANWHGLVKLYEAMKPRDAATIFNDLDMPVLLPVVDRMKDAKAAAVMALMQPDRARVLTAELAQSRARANTVAPAAAAGPPAMPAKTGGG